MRKRNKAKDLGNPPVNNPVAKFAHRYNKAHAYAGKRIYQRKSKHAGLELFSIAFAEAIEKGSRTILL